MGQVKCPASAGCSIPRGLEGRTPTSGNLVYDQRVGGSTYSYRKRLIGVQVGGATVGTYGYDYTGARVWRQASGSPAVNSQYVYDTSGHLLAEENGATGAAIREYVWLDDLPLAVIDSSSGTAQTYYIHTGPVDEPLMMTDVNKNQVWNAYMEPFGMATVFGASSAALDLRLPGQWLTAETGGLNQNGFRDYDPTLGRYVEPDPVGLEAGQNVYPYVDGDPLNRRDPRGTFAIGSVVGAIAGAAQGAAGAQLAGGDALDIAVSAAVGGGVGALVGLVDPSEGIGTLALIGAVSGAGGDLLGQGITNLLERKCTPINWGSVAGSTFAGAIDSAGAAWRSKHLPVQAFRRDWRQRCRRP